jgi:serine/threonine-protein kinase
VPKRWWGGFAGKLGYVAPEQFGDFGRQIGPWTDVYSTALVLLAFARGKAPAMGTTLSDAVERRRAPVDLSDLPVPIAPLIERMLVPEPTGRIRSMREVLVALDGIRIAAGQPLARGKAEPRSGSPKEAHAPRVKPPEPAETTYAPALAPEAQPAGQVETPSNLKPLQSKAPPSDAEKSGMGGA